MKKIIYFSIICLSSTIIFSCGDNKESVADKKTYSEQEIISESGRTRLPVLVKAGAVIPMRESQDFTQQKKGGRGKEEGRG